MKKKVYKILIGVFTFWLLDFIFHYAGVEETNYYYLSKLGNAVLFSIIWFFIFDKKESWKKIVYGFIFGTWVSFYYLISSYSGLVQWLGIAARYAPPPFVLFGISFSPILWWFFHSLTFYLGLEIAGLIKERKIFKKQ